jgi:hypothetical protein
MSAHATSILALNSWLSYLYFLYHCTLITAMTIYQFTMLDEMEQIEAFWDGVYVGERVEVEFKIECRQISSFYVEYKILGGHYIDKRLFKNPDLLQPYLDQMGRIEI